MMTELALLKLAHVIGLAYWLGGDLGVFYSSFYAADRKLPAQVRIVTTRILFALDMAPRICMPLMLALGVHLSFRLSLLPITGSTMALVWVICLAWLSMAIYLHVASPGKRKQFITSLDFWMRLGVIVVLVAYAIYSLTGSGGSPANWVSYKLIIFAVMISCGLMVRVKLRPFGPAFTRLVQGTAIEQDEAAISSSIAATRPFVLVIWAGLFVSAALGLHVI